MSAQQSKISIFTNGIIKENPVLRLVLGTCPTLAVTTAAFNGLGMGAAATFVLIGSNMVISALRKVIPDKVRLPAYITVIATFVTIVQMLVKAYAQDLYAALGVFSKLYYFGPCRDVCFQTQCSRIGIGWLRHGHWLYLYFAVDVLHSRDFGCRQHFWCNHYTRGD